MKIIIRDTVQKFSHLNRANTSSASNKTPTNLTKTVSSSISKNDQQRIKQYIESHRFYRQQGTSLNDLLIRIIDILQDSSKKPINQFVNQSLRQLALYLNRQNNKPIFSVYQHILKSNNSGISYEYLARKLNTDIINISHYCCKLKKMRFIEWDHKKQGIIVYAKKKDKQSKGLNKNSDTSNKKQLEKVQFSKQEDNFSFDYSNSFLFNELTLNQNIWLNVSGADSMIKGGLTNQDIKLKIMKHAQNKMVRRTVQGMKNIDKTAERQGKVFQFKYKKQTQQVTKQLEKKQQQNTFSQVVKLTPKCIKYLHQLFSSQYKETDEELLLVLINDKLTDYYSSVGIKQSKRQCTPLKLNRYINILNILQIQGPQSQFQLRRQIIDKQKSNQASNGIMHKRSLIGILEGLKKIQLIEQVDEYFYPKWITDFKRRIKLQSNQGQINSQRQSKPKKKVNLSSKKGLLQYNNIQIPIISEKSHRRELFTNFLFLSLQKALKRCHRKGFHRILYAHRKKQGIPMFVPEKNIFSFLDNPIQSAAELQLNRSYNCNNLSDFIDKFIEEKGTKLQQFPEIQYQVVKYVRRNPQKNSDNLRSKYGRNWQDKFEPLQNIGILNVNDTGYTTNPIKNLILL